MPNEVFLSHASRDIQFVEALVGVLRRHGIPVWYSRTNIRGAQMWHDEIGAALRRCDWFVLVLSPGAVASPWVKRELLYSLQESRYAGRIVPLLHEPCAYDELSWTLASVEMWTSRVTSPPGAATCFVSGEWNTTHRRHSNDVILPIRAKMALEDARL